MRGALKVTYTDGSHEFFEVDPAGDSPDFVEELKQFMDSPDLVLVLDNEFLIIPSTAIRHMSITRADAPIPEEALADLSGVLVGAKRIIG
jgi:hypothetical protein